MGLAPLHYEMRKLKRLVVDIRFFVSFFQSKEVALKVAGLPEGTVYAGVSHDLEQDRWNVFLQNHAWEFVPEDQSVPEVTVNLTWQPLNLHDKVTPENAND